MRGDVKQQKNWASYTIKTLSNPGNNYSLPPREKPKINPNTHISLSPKPC